jgi:hypothetical protein
MHYPTERPWPAPEFCSGTWVIAGVGAFDHEEDARLAHHAANLYAELVKACDWSLRALTEKPPIGKSYAELTSDLQNVLRKARGYVS